MTTVIGPTTHARLLEALRKLPPPARPRSITAWIDTVILIGLPELVRAAVLPTTRPIGVGGGHTVRIYTPTWIKCQKTADLFPVHVLNAQGRRARVTAHVLIRAALTVGLDAIEKALALT